MRDDDGSSVTDFLFLFCFVHGVLASKYLRALVLVPQVHTLERIGTDDVGARLVGRTVALQVPGHGGLAPLGAVHGRWQGQVFALESGRKKKRETG